MLLSLAHSSYAPCRHLGQALGEHCFATDYHRSTGHAVCSAPRTNHRGHGTDGGLVQRHPALQMLFIINTILSLIATVKFNQIALNALAPESCTTPLCLHVMFTGAVVPLLGVIFFQVVHSLGFVVIYHVIPPTWYESN